MKYIILFSALFYFGAQSAYSQNGNLDPAFGNHGIVLSDIGSYYSNQNTVGGKVLLGNNGTVIYDVLGGGGGSFITRRNSIGGRDINYGKNGFSVVVPFVGDAVIQPDGKIVVVGSIVRGEDSFEFALARYNTNGTLDNTFSGDGIRTDNFGVPSNQARSVALQADGKIVVAGNSAGFMLVRYNANGSLDNTFSGEGNHTSDDNFTPVSVVIQQNGKIVVSGTRSNSSTTVFSLSRYNANGSLDHTFGDGGSQMTSFDGYASWVSSVIQTDGKIVVAGNVRLKAYPNYNITGLARYKTNGSADSTFGINGKQTTGATLNFSYNRPSLALQSDAKILMATSILNGGNTDFAILRFNSNGSPDNTFSGDGLQTTDFNGSLDIAASLAVEKNGKIIVSGQASLPGGSTVNFALARYNTNGSADTTFGKKGIVQGQRSHGYTVYNATAVQSDGKIVAAGYTWNGEKFVFAVCRFKLNGTPDSSFSVEGIKTTSFSSGDDMANSVAIQADGKIVVAGSSGKYLHRDFAFARYNSNGDPDNTFSGDGKKLVAFGTAGDDYANAVAIQADGKIVGVGKSKDNAALVRLKPNGDLDPTFSGDGKQTNYGDYGIINAVSLQPDGKIVVAGIFGFPASGLPFVLARYNSNGNLDNTFGESGRVRGNFKYNFITTNSLAIQDNGKIIVGANVNYLDYANSFALARYTTTGKIDNSFGKNGTVVSNNFTDFIYTMAIESDGKILAGGTRNGYSAVTRINTNGSIDSTFGTDGTQTTQISGSSEQINGLAVHNNSLYAVGTALLAGNDGTVIKYQLGTSSEAPLMVNQVPASGNSTISVAADRTIPGLKSNFTVRLLPSPAFSTLNINTTGFADDGAARILLISSTGVILKSLQVNGSTPSIPINVSALKSGTYIIKVISGNKAVVKQFVKM